MLAYLLLHANRVVTTNGMVEALWGGSGPSTARTQVQTDISIIRRLFRETVDRDPIATRPAGYLITCQRGQVDIDEFVQLVTAATSVTGSDPGSGAAQLRDALALWRGPALADVSAAYVEGMRGGLEEQRLRALEQLFTIELSLGRHAEVLGELTALVEAHPLHERITGQLMLALYRSGRPAEALRVARRLCRTLAEQHGLDPGPALRDLQQAILHNDASLDLPGRGPVDVPARPRGVARPAVGRSGRGDRSVPAQLPPDVADFVGRADHQRQLDELIRRAHATAPTTVVISALLGTAGVGKTALAVHWGHSVVEHFPDGQLYVDMRGYSADTPVTPMDALSRFLRAVGLPPEQIPTTLEEASATYRTMLATRRILVVVDNASHAEQVRPLLPSAPGSLCLVTSRSQLSGLVAVNGAKPITLDALPLGDAVALLSHVISEQRAAAEPSAIAELAAVCGYLPLALRIVAARLVLNPRQRVAELVAELSAGDRLTSLSLGDDRQASVQAAFDYSYRALTPEVQRTFRLLGCAPSLDFSVPSVAELTDSSAERTGAVLRQLATAHLVTRVNGRYTMHDLIREYARTMASTEDSEVERQAAVDRLLAWLVRNTESATGMVSRPPVKLGVPAAFAGPVMTFDDPGQALAWLQAEHANLVAATRFAAGTGRGPIVWLLADLLRGYFRRGMYANDWIETAGSAIRAAQDAPDETRWRVESISHLGLGLAYQALGRLDRAASHLAAARVSAESAGWLDLEASAIGNLGVLAWRAGDLGTAAQHMSRAVEIARQTGTVGIEANNLGNLALLSRSAGRLEEAARATRDLAPLFGAAGQREGQANALSNLAEICRLLGRPEEAIRYGTQAADLFRDIGDATEAAALLTVAAACCDLGQFRRGADIGEAALKMATEAELPYLEADCLDTLAYAHRGQGEHRATVGYAEQAMRLAGDLGSPEVLIRCGLGLTAAYLATGRLDEAHAQAADTIALTHAHDGRILAATALAALAEVEVAQQDWETATMHAAQALDDSRAMGLAPVVERAIRVLRDIEVRRQPADPGGGSTAEG